ncbi:MAG: phage tail tube protein [Limnohabitans sp.]
MPLLSRRRTLLAKIETTYGTDSVPVGGSNAILCRNLDFTPLNVNIASRDLVRPFLGNFDQLIATVNAQVSFEVELAGSGAAGTVPAFGALLRACGLSETVVASTSVTYAPVSSGFESASIYFNVDGVQHRLTGCRGTVAMSLAAAQIPVLRFQFTGLYNAPSDVAVPSVTYTQVTPLPVNATNTTAFQLYSYAGNMSSFEFDLQAEIQYRELVSNGVTVSNRYIQYIDRKPQGSVVLEAVTMATRNYFTDALGTSTGNCTWQHGTTAGNRVTFTSAQADIINPAYSDDNGVQMLNIPLVFLPTTAGNNEFSLAFT